MCEMQNNHERRYMEAGMRYFMNNAAFDEFPEIEIVRILNYVKYQINQGKTIGEWEWTGHSG